MRPGIFSSAALAGLAFAATDAAAVALNPRGVGEALVYPYYTANAGQDTLIAVENVSDVGKAVKVFVREGANGRVVMDFNIFLAPHDSWGGAISSSGEGALARIGTTDHSCIDTWTSNPQPFSTSAFDGLGPGSGNPPPSGWATPDRTREGMIEIINGGDIVPGSPLDTATRPAADGAAPSCVDTNNGVVVEQYLQAPTEGLMGSAAIANVAQGTFYPYTAIALSGFSDRPLFGSSLAVVWTGLDAANTSGSANGGTIAHLLTRNGEPMTVEYTRGIDAVSAVFMTDHLYNEYLVNADIGAATDWVVTFPTREFYVDKQSFPGDVTAPFEWAANDYASPLSVTPTSWDREGLSVPIRCAPAQPCTSTLAFQVNVVPVVNASYAPTLLGSRLSNDEFLPAFSTSGFIDLTFDTPPGRHVLDGGEDGHGQTLRLYGLPVTGFMVYNIINTQAQPGRLANYGGLFPHRSTTSCHISGSDYIIVCPDG